MGGGDDDPVSRVAGPLSSLVTRFDAMHETMQQGNTNLHGPLGAISEAIGKMDGASKGGMDPQVMAQIADAIGKFGATQAAPAAAGDDGAKRERGANARGARVDHRATGPHSGQYDPDDRAAGRGADRSQQAARRVGGRDDAAGEQTAPLGCATTARHRGIKRDTSHGSNRNATGALSVTDDTNGDFSERPITGLRKKVPFKQVQQTQQAREEEGLDEGEDTEVSAAPHREQDASPRRRVKLEPPFDEA